MKHGYRGVCVLLLFSVLIGLGMPTDVVATATPAAIQPGTWAAVDGLGRTLSNATQVGTPKEEKYVGIFYWDWHFAFAKNEPRNITQILNQYPEAATNPDHAAWGDNKIFYPYFWDEPLFGYYQTEDQYVLRKHAELLADAGVDYIAFDCTNGTQLFKKGYRAVFEAFAAAKADGVDVPQITFFLSWSDTNDRAQLKQLYKDIYSEGKYKDLWFYWEGKPLMYAHTTALDASNAEEKAILDFFTFRRCYTTYFDPPKAYEEKIWGWLSVYPQTKFGVKADGSTEMICVSAAQNANEHSMVAMNDPAGGVRGRAYTKGDYAYRYQYQNKTVTIDQNTKDAYLYGLNFQQQWDYAIEQDPQVIFITGWNEYVAQMAEDFLGVSYAFSDNYNAAYSRDIEPSAGILKDYYYTQMVENIRRFKGTAAQVPATEATGAQQTIQIGGGTGEWDQVKLAYDHYTNSTLDRDHAGFGSTHYTNQTMRNDFVQAKVAYDWENLYFMVETEAAISSPRDPAWMRLFIDTDPSGVSPNWEGFEYVVNRVSPTDDQVTIERCTGGWHFTKVGTGRYHVSDNRLELSVPRSSVGLADVEALTFNFKWADNTRADDASTDSGDILDFYQYGDVAPGGRFAFTFTTEDTSRQPSATPENNSLWMIGLLGATAVVLAGAVVAVILVLKKRSKAK